MPPSIRKLQAGLTFHRQGALAEAEQCYLAVIEADPTHGEAFKLLSLIAFDRGDYEQATSYVHAALAREPGAGQYLHLLGRIQFAQDDLDAAAVSLSQALTSDVPERAQALLDLAQCHARRKAWPESLAVARRLLAEQPDHVVAERVAGFACFSLARDAEALAYFDRVLARDPERAGVWHASSVSLSRMGDALSAYPRAVRACELAPENAEYAYQRRLAAGKAVPDWHFNMLNDTDREVAFATAIANQVKPEHLVLDIGSGTGLLAMLAARGVGAAGGARRVVTCEANPVIAKAAAEVVASNGFAQRVSVISKASSDLQVGVDLPERADVLICEVFSVQVISEGVLPTVEDAKARLLKPDALIIPARATACGALVAGDSLARQVRVGWVQGLDLSSFNAFTPPLLYLAPGQALEWLSEAVELLSFDLARGHGFPAQKQVLEVPVSSSGLCQGVVQWLRLELAPGVHFDNRPNAESEAANRHWAPVFYPFARPVPLQAGQTVTLRASHNRVGMHVELVSLGKADLNQS